MLHGTYVGGGRMLVAPLWGGRLLMPSEDISLMPELVVTGTYDVPFTAFVQNHIRPGDTAVDVGANAGLFTLLLGYQVWEMGRVIAYEANPALAKILGDNVAMNWLGDRITVVPKAASATHGTATLTLAAEFNMLATIHAHDRPHGSSDETVTRVEVPTEPLDARLQGIERVELIKIDVEGAEERVLAGLEQTLAAGVVRSISLEMSRTLLGSDWEPFTRRVKALESRGWTFATLPDSGFPEPAPLDALLDRGTLSQLAMFSPDWEPSRP